MIIKIPTSFQSVKAVCFSDKYYDRVCSQTAHKLPSYLLVTQQNLWYNLLVNHAHFT